MTKRISIVLSVVFLLLGACSSSQQVDPLNEDLVFDEEQADLVQDLDFDSVESDDEEFLALDKAEDAETVAEKSDGDFADFDAPEKSDDEFTILEEEDKTENFDGEFTGLIDEETSDDDFADFDFEEKSDSSDNFVLEDENSGDETTDFDFSEDSLDQENSDFAFFDEQEKPAVTPPLADLDTPFPEDVGFDSPLELDDSPLGLDDSEVSETTFDLSAEASTSSGSNNVLSVDYNALQNGGSFIVSTTSTPFYETEFIPETNQYILKLNKSQISSQLSRPFLTKDFRQSFEAMNSYKGKDESVKFVFQLKPNSYPKVSRVGNQILIEPGIREQGNTKQNQLMSEKDKNLSLSATSFEDFLLDKNNYVGQKINLQVKEESVVTIIQFISEQVGANIVISENVKGKISIKLKEVPWDQALISIMKTKGLGYVRSGNILRVATLAELKAESSAATEIQNARKTLEPFHVKVFPLSYAKPQELEIKLKPFLTLAPAGSTRVGQVISEDRSSSLIIRDTLEVIKNVSTLIKELDRPPLQVMIQAKIVEANKNFTKKIQSFLQSSAGNNIAGSDFTASARAAWTGEGTENFFVPQVILGGVNFLGTLTARLRLQELESNLKVLSAPSVMAINNEKAIIVQNDQIVNVQTILNEGGGSTSTPEFRDVKLSLDVTPQVSSDSSVIMDIDVKREFPQVAGSGFTTVSSRSAKTKVLIGNNRTGMIGGIYQVTENKSETGTPYLRKIPLLKWLFNNSEYSKIDSELVIFITPRVIGPSSIGGPAVASKKLSPRSGSALTKK